MVEDEKNGLPRSPALEAEGDVRKALSTLVDDIDKMRLGLPCNGYADQQLERVQHRLLDIRETLSAEGSANAAAARLAAEEMRERAAMVAEDWRESSFLDEEFAAGSIAFPIRALPLPPSSSPEDQEKAKAAATPTIADPDGESGR